MICKSAYTGTLVKTEGDTEIVTDVCPDVDVNVLIVEYSYSFVGDINSGKTTGEPPAFSE